MQKFSSSPLEIVKSFLRHRSLIWALTKREVVGRYKGSVLGFGWSFARPLFMLTIYALVFGEILQLKWGSSGESSTSEFAIILLAGLLIFDFFSDVVNRSPTLVLANPNYVKKVVFPLEILPFVSIASALIHLFASLLILLLGQLFISHALPWTAIIFPLVLIPLILGCLGAAWFLASLGVYLRDVSQLVGTLTTALLFVSGVFFPASALPQKYRVLLDWNPLSWCIESSRQVLIYAEHPSFSQLSWLILLMSMFAWLGFVWFQQTRRGFADVI